MTNLTANEREFIQLFRDSDEAGKMHILKMLACTTCFGKDYYSEMIALHKNGDTDGMRECTDRWYDRGCEMLGIERMTI